MKNYKEGRIIHEMQETIFDLHSAGAITNKSMREFEALKRLDAKPMTQTRIKRLRADTKTDL